MAVYQTKAFARFVRKSGISTASILVAAREVEEGNHDADLGGGVFKKRLARDGEGKSGGFRTLLFFRRGSHVVFAHGFAKNEKANVTRKELDALKKLAGVVLGFSADDVARAEAAGELIEVEANDGDQKN